MVRRLAIMAALGLVVIFFTPGYVRATSSNAIEGTVYQYGTTNPVQGVNVYWALLTGCDVYGNLCAGGSQGSVTTGIDGHFIFQSVWIDKAYAGHSFLITVNGYDQVAEPTITNGMGQHLDNPDWTQWEGMVTLNSNGYASKTISIDRTSTPVVPVAALFDHSSYTTLEYDTTTSNTFAHSYSFQVSNNGISTEYLKEDKFSVQWTVLPGYSKYFGRTYAASSIWCDAAFSSFYEYCSNTGVKGSGIVQPYLNQGPAPVDTQDYIDPNKLPTNDFMNFPIPVGSPVTYTLAETHATTWSKSLGVSFSVGYKQFGTQINVDETVTTQTSTATSMKFTFNNNDPTGTLHEFMMYPIFDAQVTQGSSELHAWECPLIAFSASSGGAIAYTPPSGTISYTPSGTQVGSGGATFTNGQSVIQCFGTFTAIANNIPSGYTFFTWSTTGGVSAISPISATSSVYVTGPGTLTLVLQTSSGGGGGGGGSCGPFCHPNAPNH